MNIPSPIIVANGAPPIFPTEDTGSADYLPLDDQFVEMAFLLARPQAEAFSKAARQLDMTAGQLLRRIVGATLAGLAPAMSPAPGAVPC